MKRVLLIVLGLSLFAWDGNTQGRGRGNGHGNKGIPPGHQKKERVAENNRYHKDRYKSKGYEHRDRSHNNRDVIEYRKRGTVVTRRGGSVVYRRPAGQVRVEVRPRRVHYTRRITVAPVRTYFYVDARIGRRVRSNVLWVDEVDAIAWEMQGAYYEEDRLSIAMSAVNGNMLYAEDVAYLMSFLNYEDSRLDLAKFAYLKTVDRQNYGFVYDELKFRSSRRELERFIDRRW